MLSRTDLYPYQERAVSHIKQHERCALFIDCGLGKTVSALTAFTDMLDKFDARRMLVVAPLRVARKVWSDEVGEWAHTRGLTVARIVGTPEERFQALKTPADIHTINREQLTWLQNIVIQGRKQLKRWPWDVVALDESQSFKSPDSERFRSMKLLQRLCDRLVLLTGTPRPNSLYDLWAQFYLLDRGARLGATQKAFKARWFDPQMRDDRIVWVAREKAQKEISRLIGDITISLREEDYLVLPPVQNNFVKVALSGPLLDRYKKFEKECLLKLSEQVTITSVNAGAACSKLQQFVNGAIYDAERTVHAIHEEKIAALQELMDGVSGKALIAYNFVHDLDRLRPAIDAYCGLDRSWAFLRSDSDFDRWAAGELDYGILHPASAGHGLNDVYKAGAEDLIWFGPTNNRELYDQLNKRLTGGHRRAGRNIRIHHIIAEHTIDTDLIALLTKKGAEQDDLKQLLAQRVKEITCRR